MMHTIQTHRLEKKIIKNGKFTLRLVMIYNKIRIYKHV